MNQHTTKQDQTLLPPPYSPPRSNPPMTSAPHPLPPPSLPSTEQTFAPPNNGLVNQNGSLQGGADTTMANVDPISPIVIPPSTEWISLSNEDPLMYPDINDICPSEQYFPTAGQKSITVVLSNWSTITHTRNPHRIESPVFASSDASRWKLLLFPCGNQEVGCVSAYLVSVDAEERKAALEAKATAEGSALIPADRWALPAKFALVIPNPVNPNPPKLQVDSNRFGVNSLDWGYNSLVRHHELRNLTPGDALRIQVYVRVFHDDLGILFHRFHEWDSKQETGFVGLNNQGATCYMNSLLQSLYFLPYFRKATYQIPTSSEKPAKSIPLALQRLFFNLEHSDYPVSTTELTQSFGWDTRESFMQHDVQEFNRVLQDNLEEKMKGTAAEGAISKLFVGKMKSFIKCCDVDFESSRIEDFYDIQLNVKNCKDLEASFANYCSTETLEGENAYMAEGFGLQKASKGVIFTEFPPVLHLQLKRFEYDFMRDAMVKINDRHEFPLEIDLSSFLETPPQTPQVYHLHGVLVHAGHLNGGHYFAMIRPSLANKWFKFDDDRVIPVPLSEVFEANFGGALTARAVKKHSNAYMLVYIRDSDRGTVLAPLQKSDIPPHLEAMLKMEDELRASQALERENELLNMNFYVTCDRDLTDLEACEFDILSPTTYKRRLEALNHEPGTPRTSPLTAVKVRRDADYPTMLKAVAKALSMSGPIELWCFTKRQNGTNRLETCLTGETIGAEQLIASEISQMLGSKGTTFPEVLYARPMRDQIMSHALPNSALIFIKFYNPEDGTLALLGSILFEDRRQLVCESVWSVVEAYARKQHSEYYESPLEYADMMFWEEIKPGMIERIHETSTFSMAEIGHGDIVVFQWKADSDQNHEVPTAADYFSAIQNRVTITFASEGRSGVDICLDRRQPLEYCIVKLGEVIGVDPYFIQLSGCYYIPEPTRLTEIMPFAAATKAVVNYQIFSMPCSEFEHKRFVPVLFENTKYDCFMLKTANMNDLMDELIVQAKVAEESKKHLVLYEAGHNNRIARLHGPSDPISLVADDGVVISQVIDLTASPRVIPVFHFDKEPRYSFGVPFLFPLKAGESISQMKARLFQSHLTGMSSKEVSRMRMFLLTEGVGRRQGSHVELVAEDIAPGNAASPPLPENGLTASMTPGSTLPNSPLIPLAGGEDVVSNAHVASLPSAAPSSFSADTTNVGATQGPPVKLARSTASSELKEDVAGLKCLLDNLPPLPPLPWYPPGPDASDAERAAWQAVVAAQEPAVPAVNGVAAIGWGMRKSLVGAVTTPSSTASMGQPAARSILPGVEGLLVANVIGLDHIDKAKYQRTASVEHSIKIFN